MLKFLSLPLKKGNQNFPCRSPSNTLPPKQTNKTKGRRNKVGVQKRELKQNTQVFWLRTVVCVCGCCKCLGNYFCHCETFKMKKCTETIVHFVFVKFPERKSVRGPSSRNVQNEKVYGDHRPFCHRESVRGPTSILASRNIQNEKAYVGQRPFCHREIFTAESPKALPN